MDETLQQKIRQLPRPDLESFAVRAALHIRTHHKESETAHFFNAAMFGFLLGVIVATSGFLFGVSLG